MRTFLKICGFVVGIIIIYIFFHGDTFWIILSVFLALTLILSEFDHHMKSRVLLAGCLDTAQEKIQNTQTESEERINVKLDEIINSLACLEQDIDQLKPAKSLQSSGYDPPF